MLCSLECEKTVSIREQKCPMDTSSWKERKIDKQEEDQTSFLFCVSDDFHSWSSKYQQDYNADSTSLPTERRKMVPCCVVDMAS